MADTKKLDNRHVEHWERQPGFVYFIGAGEIPSAVKIGISTAKTMSKRLRTMQTSNHEPLYILGLVHFENGEMPMADANMLELELHERFGGERRFGSGPGNEWFNITHEILEYVAENSTKPEEHGLSPCVAKPGPGLNKLRTTRGPT